MALPPTRASGPYRPTRIGQWEVIAKIAGGGMSALYLGRRVEPTTEGPNIVAVKIMRHDVRTDDRLAQMFLDEGRLIQRLVHPNIVRTLEVGADAEQDFIAMELMLGKTFAAIWDATLTRDVRLNAMIAAWTAARIAEALHYAHELADESGRPLGLVHRDVNPANVFATFDGRVKLFDFGLAKVTAGEASGSQMLAGKLSYLSPEQIMQMPLDRRSDIFSLGTTLWELLAGRRLFRRDSDIDTVRAVQLGPIPDPRMVAAEVPEELARIAKTALERNREHRYPTAQHLAAELDAFILAHTTHDEMSARLAQLVDMLFPGEQKRQLGWMKQSVVSRSGPPSGPPPSVARGLASSTPAAFVPPSGRPRVPLPLPSSRPSPVAGKKPRKDPTSATDIQARPPSFDGGITEEDSVSPALQTERDLRAAPAHADYVSEPATEVSVLEEVLPPPAPKARPPLPLPTRAKTKLSASGKKADDAPASDTQIDLPVPPPRKR